MPLDTDKNKDAAAREGHGNGRVITADEYFQRMRHPPRFAAANGLPRIGRNR